MFHTFLWCKQKVLPCVRCHFVFVDLYQPWMLSHFVFVFLNLDFCEHVFVSIIPSAHVNRYFCYLHMWTNIPLPVRKYLSSNVMLWKRSWNIMLLQGNTHNVYLKTLRRLPQLLHTALDKIYKQYINNLPDKHAQAVELPTIT